MQSSRALPNTFAFIDVVPNEPIKIDLNRQLDDLIRDENERNLHPAASSPLSKTTNKKKHVVRN